MGWGHRGCLWGVCCGVLGIPSVRQLPMLVQLVAVAQGPGSHSQVYSLQLNGQVVQHGGGTSSAVISTVRDWGNEESTLLLLLLHGG